jgi:hypothetical protein
MHATSSCQLASFAGMRNSYMRALLHSLAGCQIVSCAAGAGVLHQPRADCGLCCDGPGAAGPGAGAPTAVTQLHDVAPFQSADSNTQIMLTASADALASNVQVVTCSGFESAGSLRIVRNGIGVIEQATVELEGERACRHRTSCTALYACSMCDILPRLAALHMPASSLT